MAEVLLRRRLEAAGVVGTVSSAGLLPGGAPATDHGVATMAARGLDLSGHVSREVERSLLAAADVIIGMTREHIREVAVLDDRALSRAFTLKELVAAGESVGPRRPDESLDRWLARCGVGRRHEVLLGVGHDDALDVADPVGHPREDYETAADEIDALLARLVAVAWPEQGRGRADRSTGSPRVDEPTRAGGAAQTVRETRASRAERAERPPRFQRPERAQRPIRPEGTERERSA
jgi:protein-tyrosine phosphatase